LWSKKIKPGLAAIDPTPANVEAYATTLFAGAPAQQLPVYFYATAGMRLLPPAKQNKFYQELKNWFSQQDQWQLNEAKTITGNDEALYDWLSVNYHLGTLQNGKNKSVGVMDMGGASVQIVFPTVKNDKSKNNSQVEFDLYGQHINLFAYSFLGLGQTEVSHQFLNSPSCFAENFPLPDGSLGQGDVGSCEQEISTLVTSIHGVDKIVRSLLAANPVDSWYAMGGISNLASNPLFHFTNSQLTNQTLIEQADSQICHQSWNTIDAQYPDDDYVYQYCLLSAYYYALMIEGYGIYPEQVVNYIPPNQNLDWTLGVVLRHSSANYTISG